MTSFANSPHNATEGWKVESGLDIETGDEFWFVMVTADCPCECPNCKATIMKPHSSGRKFTGEDGASDAQDWIEGVQESLDEQYERYTEENGYAIAQQERYEQFRNEF